MTKKSHRIIITLSALVLATVIILILSFIGGRSRGPLEGLVNEAGSMVNKVEAKVIIQNRVNKRSDVLSWFKPYIGDISLLKNPKVMLFGAFDNQATESFEPLLDFEDSLRTTFALIHLYSAWGSKAEEQFPETQVKAIAAMGSVPLITWEPWLTDFDAAGWPELRKVELRDKGGMADVAQGKYDRYIQQWASDAKDSHIPVMICVGHEMNDPYRYPWGPQNNTAKDFKAAWRHIVNVFRAVGATNVIWIWSPHPAYGWFDAYYPGKDYVDYVGISVLNYGTVASWSKWWSFDEILGNHYKELVKFKKPLMITEFGCLNVGGSRSNWFKEALAGLPSQYPAVKALLFFHYSNDRTTTQQALNWYIKDDTASLRTIIRQMNAWPDSLKPGK
jgi:hypothetical protein